MKNKIKLGLSILSLVAIISSCSTSNDVASNRKIQKRKYTKGFSISKNDNVAFNKKHKATTTTVEIKEVENIAVADVEKVEKTINSTSTNNSIVEETTIITPANEVTNSTVEENQVNSVAKSNSPEELEGVKSAETEKTQTNSKTVKKESKKNSFGANGFALGTLILVIIAIFIPPLAVFLYEGVTKRFWVNLILYLLIITALIALIHAILVVTGAI